MLVKGIVALALIASTGVAPPSALTSPSPAATAVPLKVIVRVKATTPCTQMAVHANAAIFLTERNDITVRQTISRLHSVHLSDGNVLHRQQGLHDLFALATQLLTNARSADKQTAKILRFANSLKDPKEKADLIAFVHALGGAVGRQRKMARVLNGFVLGMQTDDSLAASPSAPGMPNPTDSTFGVAQAIDMARRPPDWNTLSTEQGASGSSALSSRQQADVIARAFNRRISAITLDENSAAQPILRAAEHC